MAKNESAPQQKFNKDGSPQQKRGRKPGSTNNAALETSEFKDEPRLGIALAQIFPGKVQVESLQRAVDNSRAVSLVVMKNTKTKKEEAFVMIERERTVSIFRGSGVVAKRQIVDLIKLFEEQGFEL